MSDDTNKPEAEEPEAEEPGDAVPDDELDDEIYDIADVDPPEAGHGADDGPEEGEG